MRLASRWRWFKSEVKNCRTTVVVISISVKIAKVSHQPYGQPMQESRCKPLKNMISNVKIQDKFLFTFRSRGQGLILLSYTRDSFRCWTIKWRRSFITSTARRKIDNITRLIANRKKRIRIKKWFVIERKKSISWNNWSKFSLELEGEEIIDLASLRIWMGVTRVQTITVD